jgi:NAD(P)-dependent dehydrogenase (short-subunit alcohol dehydrogenase family)
MSAASKHRVRRPNFAVYAACKAGMLNFTRSMALELAEHSIRINAIAPDYTVTPGVRGNHTGPVDPSASGLSRIPRRPMQPRAAFPPVVRGSTPSAVVSRYSSPPT